MNWHRLGSFLKLEVTILFSRTQPKNGCYVLRKLLARVLTMTSSEDRLDSDGERRKKQWYGIKLKVVLEKFSKKFPKKNPSCTKNRLVLIIMKKAKKPNEVNSVVLNLSEKWLFWIHKILKNVWPDASDATKNRRRVDKFSNKGSFQSSFQGDDICPRDKLWKKPKKKISCAMN